LQINLGHHRRKPQKVVRLRANCSYISETMWQIRELSSLFLKYQNNSTPLLTAPNYSKLTKHGW